MSDNDLLKKRTEYFHNPAIALSTVIQIIRPINNERTECTSFKYNGRLGVQAKVVFNLSS